MVLRKMTTVFGVIAAGAIAGMIGQNLVAQAGAPALSDKTIYGKANPAFIDNLTTSLGAPKTLLQITIHAPAAGQVDLIINSQLWTDFPSSDADELENVLNVARCGAPDTLVACANNTSYWFHKAPHSGSADSTEPYSIQAQLNFTAAGNRTFYLNGSADEYPGGIWGDVGAHVQVAFTPRVPISNSAHVTVSAVAPGADH